MYTNPRLLPQLSLWLNYYVNDLNTRGYHLTNLVIHIANGLILFYLARLALRQTTLHAAKKTSQLAFAIAGLWVIHPLASQAVIYIIQRAELMCSFWYMFCLYAITRSSINNKHRSKWMIASWIGCALGLYCKPVMATLPIVALLWDRILLVENFKQLVKKRWLLHAGLFACLLILTWTGTTNLLSTTNTEHLSAGLSVKTISPIGYLLAQSRIILHYLQLSIWPAALVFDYGWPKHVQQNHYAISFAITTVLFLITVGSLFTRFAKVGLVAMIFFLILAPTSSFIPLFDLAVEHRMYLPLACIVVLFVMLLTKVLSNQPNLVAMILIIIALMLTGRTWLRANDYSSELRLWQSVLKHRPKHSRMWFLLGHALQDKGQTITAAKAFDRAIASSNNKPTRVNNLAHRKIAELLINNQKYSPAIEYLEAALNTVVTKYLTRVPYSESGRLRGTMRCFSRNV